MVFNSFVKQAIGFFKTLSGYKIWNSFLLRLSYHLSSHLGIYLHWGNPESLSIEPTNLCNLKCPECPSGNNGLTRPRLFLSEADYKSIIDQSSKFLVYLQLFFQGEPFLHPRLFDFISYATSKNIYTGTSTNGQFLTHENSKKIVQSGLHQLIISIDGTTQEVYEKYRVGGSIELVKSGISNIVYAKHELNSQTPYLVMQFVVFKTNEHQISDVKALAKELKVDKLELKSAQIDNYINGSDLIPENAKYSRYQADNSGKFWLKRNPNFKCKRIWMGSVVTAENELLPCCFDKNAHYSYGKPDSAFKLELWKSEKAKNFRKAVWNNYSQFDICKNCTEGLK